MSDYEEELEELQAKLANNKAVGGKVSDIMA